MRTRRGFSVLEVVIALFILCVGALMLAATSVKSAQAFAASRLRTLAATTLEGKRESFLAGPCRNAETGSESRGGILTTWRVSDSANGAQRFHIELTYATAFGKRRDTLEVLRLC